MLSQPYNDNNDDDDSNNKKYQRGVTWRWTFRDSSVSVSGASVRGAVVKSS